MITETNNQLGHSTAVAEHALNCRPAPKWAVVLDDRLFPMPRRKLTSRDILDQASVGQEFSLVRDHNSPDDVVLDPETLVDLADGNVFRVIPRCTSTSTSNCIGLPKLAFVCDDDWEVTLVPKQTGRSLKRLLGLPSNASLSRDYESPTDLPIEDDVTVEFGEGAVFQCRHKQSLINKNILVNGREKTVPGKSISYSEIVILAFGSIAQDTIYTVTFKYGPPSKPEGQMVGGDVVKLQCGMQFNVTPTCKS